MDTDWESDDAPDAPDDWVPDEQLVPAIIAGSKKRMRYLPEPDRAWVVAGLGVRGLTAEDIATRLDCSLRLVRTIRAWPMTRVCRYAQVETVNFTKELALADSARRSAVAAHTELAGQCERIRAQRDRMLDEKICGHRVFPGCGHPMDRYNTYENNGKKFCRACGRDRSKNYRDRQGLKRAESAPAAVKVNLDALTVTGEVVTTSGCVQIFPDASPFMGEAGVFFGGPGSVFEDVLDATDNQLL